MPSVRIRENEYFDAALRRFKRAWKAGVLTELRRREFYEKPTQEREAQEGGRREAPPEAQHPRLLVSASRPQLLIRLLDRPQHGCSSVRSSRDARHHDDHFALKERITEDMKSAMRAGEKERLGHPHAAGCDQAARSG